MIRDNWVLNELKSCLEMPVFRPMTGFTDHPPEVTEPYFYTVRFYPAYYEYDVDDTGVTRYVVYLPEGAKPPREGGGA